MQPIALVTGASAGIGRASALSLAKAGYAIIATARREERLRELEKEVCKHAPYMSVVMDVQDADAVGSAISSLPHEFSSIDLLVNNAGLALGVADAQDADLEDWEQMIDTNIKGLLYCTKAVLPIMLGRNSGHIINLGSIAGSWPYRGGNVYGATKAFVAQLSRNLRTDLLGTALRVTNIEPGMTDTEFSTIRYKGNVEKADAVYQGTTALLAEDIAEIITWAALQPAHVNINSIEVMPTAQAWGGMAVSRK